MKYNLCSACVYFQPKLLTEEKSVPKSCNRDELFDLFGAESGGFPSGCDIIHCDFFCQFPAMYGDVALRDCKSRMVSYVLTQARNFKLIRCPRLYDNSKSIKIHDIEKRRTDELEVCPY